MNKRKITTVSGNQYIQLYETQIKYTNRIRRTGIIVLILALTFGSAIALMLLHGEKILIPSILLGSGLLFQITGFILEITFGKQFEKEIDKIQAEGKDIFQLF